MTRALCDNARKVLAVELDFDLVDILETELSAYDNLEIRQGDILKQDIVAIAKEYNDGNPIKVVANLPYYITTPIIMQPLETHTPRESITVMVQKEVADRMMASPETRIAERYLLRSIIIPLLTWRRMFLRTASTPGRTWTVRS